MATLFKWFFGGFDGIVQVLLAFSIIDYLSGTCAAWYQHEISLSTSLQGINKKIILFTFVGVANLIDKNMLGQGDVMRMAVCLFYIGNEGISIIENADKIGIAIPNLLRKKFLNMKEEQEKNNHEANRDKITDRTGNNDKHSEPEQNKNSK
ncbi:MAG: phage holin family protein [Synergistaceae bacterium]|nr:phage holin family protein [Synergistaceae bacterium]